MLTSCIHTTYTECKGADKSEPFQVIYVDTSSEFSDSQFKLDQAFDVLFNSLIAEKSYTHSKKTINDN